MESRDKRDLPEVVAEILIEQHAMRADIAGMREEIGGLRQELKAGLDNLAQTFNGMTNAILNAMNRGTDRYERTNQEVDHLQARVTKLENPAPDAA